MTTPEGVFINCPFDEEHRPVHHAILTTVIACGLEPRSALESGSTALPRMQRISRALRQSRYSVHDLSRAFGDPKRDNLARLNMPFEFGMAFLHAEYTNEADVQHDWLGLVPSSHRHGEFISDLSGYDLKDFDGTAQGVIPPFVVVACHAPDHANPAGWTRPERAWRPATRCTRAHRRGKPHLGRASTVD